MSDVQIALLRGVNVGGAKSVAMADLRALCEGIGLNDVRSLMQSGNLVFRSTALHGEALEKMLAAEARERLGLKTDFFIRTAAEMAAIVAANPFPDEAEQDPSHLLVTFLKEAPTAAQMEALDAKRSGPERIHVSGRQIYITYPDGIADSRLKLAVHGTARNWSTVGKLAAMATA